MNLWHHKDHSGAVTAGEIGHSQYGTPLGEIIGADADCDAQKWMLIPTNWADSGGRWRGPEEWAQAMAPLCWGAWVELTPGAVNPGPTAVARTALELRSFAERFGGFDPKQPFQIITYVYLPDPNRYAMPVHLWVDDRPGLTVEAATEDPDATEPPKPEDFVTDALGKGRKVTTHGVLDPQPGDLPGTQPMWVTVRYAFAVPARQAVVTVKATETDLARMSAAAADLDEFVRTITLSLADNTPVVIGSTTGPAADP
ncbi:MAG TPA: hypothetical protein VHV82_03460 [Sporichthyaceae bacterium]|jgi:hypothetical protein|nr:hypothetical protein [Sporichthyaceae bacterium]